jgi:hypothetical protein
MLIIHIIIIITFGSSSSSSILIAIALSPPMSSPMEVHTVQQRVDKVRA